MTASTRARWGRRRKVAVVELDERGREMFAAGRPPAMISERAVGVERIVSVDTGYHGKHYPAGRCEASRLFACAHALADKLNGGGEL